MAQVIDIEEYVANGKKVPIEIGTQYRVRVNCKTIVFPKRFVIAREILFAAGYDHEKSVLLAVYKGSHHPSQVGNNETIDIAGGVLRFIQLRSSWHSI